MSNQDRRESIDNRSDGGFFEAELWHKQNQVFEELMASVPEEEEAVRKALSELRSRELGKLLDSASLIDLKNNDRVMHNKVMSFYSDFVIAQLGID